MKKRPIWYAEDHTETDLLKLPIGSILVVNNYNSTGTKAFVKKNNTNLTAATTVLQAVTDLNFILEVDLSTKADVNHNHGVVDITGLQAALDAKSNSDHTHTYGIVDITGLQTALDGKAAAAHTHTIANVTGLQTALDAKIGAANYATSTVGGTVKARLNGSTLYITTNGNNA